MEPLLCYFTQNVFEGQNTILVLIRGSCLEKSSKPVPQEGRVLFALGDKSGGQLGRRGKNLNTMHIPLMKSEQNLWYMTHKHFYSFVLRVGCVAAGSSSAQNMTAHAVSWQTHRRDCGRRKIFCEVGSGGRRQWYQAGHGVGRALMTGGQVQSLHLGL